MRLYRLLLHVYPRSFRVQYGADLCADFARRQRAAASPAARLLLWFEAIADIVRNASGLHVDLLSQDLRHTARSLARARGFTLTAIIVSALGVGATTAAFSIADHVLVAAASVPGVRSSRPDLAGPVLPRLPANGALAEQLSRLEAAGHVLRRHDGVHLSRGQPGRAGRSGAARRNDRHAGRVCHRARAGGPRPYADQHRCARDERSHGRPQLPPLANGSSGAIGP